MDNKKIRGLSSSSSSSFTNDLFGAKESSQLPSSSTGIFSSIFPPPSTAAGRNSCQKQCPGGQAWSKGTPGRAYDMTKNREGVSHSKSTSEKSSIYQDRVEPCPLSSSLYYGGQEDMYGQSSSAQTTGSYSKFKKNEGEDDVGRGNWWQGSLYY